MRICIFSDIHGNIAALRKMLESEKDNVELFIFAGDIFGYFYDQEEIINTFMPMKNLIAIKGNHEDYYLKKENVELLKYKYGSSYDIELSEKQREFIQNLPIYTEVTIDKKKIGVYHGGYLDYLEQRIYPDTVIELSDEMKKYNYIIFGHTHYQFKRIVDSTIIINPGSLGQPRDGKGFSYCILDLDTDECFFKTVNVCIENLIEQVKIIDKNNYIAEYLVKKYGE